MVGPSKSRWVDEEGDAAAEAQRKQEKEEKRRVKAEKQQKVRENENYSRQSEEDRVVTAQSTEDAATGNDYPVAKRRKLTSEPAASTHGASTPITTDISGDSAPRWKVSRHVSAFERLNHIEEGSYGFVSRARETATGQVVALKKLKMESSSSGEGFPVTGLREIQCLMESRHRHVVELLEVVVGDGLDEVFLVMEFLEHDLKTLQEEMQEPFLPSEIKTLLLQIGSAVGYLHDHWILHRDLKTSNILMNNRGEIKLADFGMARYFGDPPPQMTQLVVTLWYRAPELLLGASEYGRAIDIWSVGCIFGELITKVPLLQGKNEVDQLSKIFELCGIPTEENWPGFKRLPNARALKLPRSQQNAGAVIRAKFPFLTSAGVTLLTSLLSLNPSARPGASDILVHPYFREDPRPKSTAMFPTFPSKAGQEKRRRLASPSAPKRGDAPKIVGDMADFSSIFASRDEEEAGAGFQLKLI